MRRTVSTACRLGPCRTQHTPPTQTEAEQANDGRGRQERRSRQHHHATCVSKALDCWAYDHGVTLTFSRPGKPTDNAFIESFNGRFRDECLNVNWFLSLEDAREKSHYGGGTATISGRIRLWETCRPGPTPRRGLRRARELRSLTPGLDQERGEARELQILSPGPHQERGEAQVPSRHQAGLSGTWGPPLSRNPGAAPVRWRLR